MTFDSKIIVGIRNPRGNHNTIGIYCTKYEHHRLKHERRVHLYVRQILTYVSFTFDSKVTEKQSFDETVYVQAREPCVSIPCSPMR